MRGRRQVSWALLCAGYWLAGCSSPQMGRIDSNRNAYESWPLETRQAVLDGRAEPGMTPDMVRMAMGKPTEIISRTANGGDEIWVYIKGGQEEPMGIDPGIGATAGSGGMIVGPGPMGPMGGMSSGMGGPMMNTGMRPVRISPMEVREVVFRDGVVERADPPP